MPEYACDINEGAWDFSNYGKSVYRPTLEWQDKQRDDIIYFHDSDQIELDADLRMGTNVDNDTSKRIVEIIKEYWDCFCKEGAKRTIIGYEFGIDTGNAKPVCCRKPSYGPYEAEIIMTFVRQLINNIWISRCRGPWGSQIVLAQKPHQEHITSIDDFIWRMCVSYRALNAVTKPFQYPIPRCDDSVTFIANGANGEMYFISLDARQGYHQVSVRSIDREKLAFFAPDDHKYCFNVMPFGPTNAPAFYTAMMKRLKDEWDILFIIRVKLLTVIGAEIIRVTEANEIFVGTKKIVSGSRTIIDDIILYCSNKPLIILYFECVCIIFKKYRVSFRLDKCEFLKERVEYVGVDIMKDGNTPAQSKFKMINDWKLPTSGQALFSFIGLINFYHRYAPYFEMRLKPLRKLCKRFYRKEIPQMGWTMELISLFEELKVGITSSPVLARFDADKPTFLKTDWSAEGMGWILMQPADDEESIKATKLLKETGECKFDLTMNGARLKPIFFGSRSCNDMERKYHSFTGEGACGRWAIGQNRKYLWGCHFYWLCDCSAMKELLEYDGSISMISRWAQELLGYHFTVIHRPARMMRDVDAITRRFGPMIARHMIIALILSARDKATRPDAYDANTFGSSVKASSFGTGPDDNATHDDPVLITKNIDHSFQQFTAETPDKVEPQEALQLATSPIMMIHAAQISCQQLSTASTDVRMRTLDIPDSMEINWLCINDITGAALHYTNAVAGKLPLWTTHNVFTSPSSAVVFDLLHGHDMRRIVPILDIGNDIRLHPKLHLIDIHYVKEKDISIVAWTSRTCTTIKECLETHSYLQAVMIWIPADHFPPPVHRLCLDIIRDTLPEPWMTSISKHHAVGAGDCVSATRYLLCIKHDTCITNTTEEQAFMDETDVGYGQYLEHDSDDAPDTRLILDHDINLEGYMEHDPNLSRTVAMMSSGSNSDRDKISYADMILDPAFPGQEPVAADRRNTILGRRFGIPITTQDASPLNKEATGTMSNREKRSIRPTPHQWSIRPMSNREMLRMYSIPMNKLSMCTEHVALTRILDNGLPFSLPWKLREQTITNLLSELGILDKFVQSSSVHCDTIQCYFTKQTPETLDWKAAYESDINTSAIMRGLTLHKATEWTLEEITTAGSGYKLALQQGRILMVDQKLVFFKPIFQQTRYVGLIIVPSALRRKIFSHYHAGPSAGHMGEYKTLFRMRLRFFWPGLRKDVKEWIKGCAHCNSYNIWKTRKSELYFSWPVTSPFYIMHVDLWAPGKIVNKQTGKTQMLLNSMCDLTQFVVSSITENPTAESLAQIFMEDVVLTFGMVAVVVVDADSKFLREFEQMCIALKMVFWPLARGNHKAMRVECYHRFLNKTQTIVGQDRGTHETFIQNAKTSQYAWNSAPIDDTDISRSMAAVGRDFKFPMDVELSAMPTINDNKNSALYKYLRDVSNDSKFATSVVQILVDERREAHRLRWNKDKVEQLFEVGDVVKAHVQVNSNAAHGEVGKLSYQAKGPFQITECLGHNSYEVKRYNDPESASRKYKGTELYLLPPAIFPHEPLDMMDERYLNYSHAPIVSPLKKSLRIEMYNDTYFSPDAVQLDKPMANQPSNDIDKQAFTAHNEEVSLPAAQLFAETGNAMPATEEIPTITDSTCEHNVIESSEDKLFFIRFTPERTMRPRWYLIQIDMQSTEETNPLAHTNGKYWCMFLAKHPEDNKTSDEFSRWWPEWYRYTHCKKTNDVVYGDRILIRPSTTPDSSKFVQWAMELQLFGQNNCNLVGPFNFEEINASNRMRQKVPRLRWTQLQNICNTHGILPPTFGSNTNIPIAHLKKVRTRKRKNSK